MINWITIGRAAELTGYSEDAIRAKLERGVWPEGVVWRRAPDNRVLISCAAYDAWAEDRLGEFLAPAPAWERRRELARRNEASARGALED